MNGTIVWMRLAIAMSLTAISALNGQAIDGTTTGPHFFYAASANSAPVKLDVSRTAILHKRLVLNLDNATLKNAIATIASEAGIAVWYSDDILKHGTKPDTRINLKAKDITLVAALTSVLVESGIDVVFGRDGNATLVAQPVVAALPAGELSGRVIDAATGKPLGKVSVSVSAGPSKATTNDAGEYRLTGLDEGKVLTLHFRRLGYQPTTVSVTVGANGSDTSVPDVAMAATANGLDRVVVTGTVIPTEVRALPSPITIVTAKQLQEQNITSIDQVFNYMVPGGVARDDTPGIGGYANFSVRGTTDLGGGTSTFKVLVDGVELDDPSRIRNIDPASVDHIEIISGPQASTIYGSGASSGVMQIFTKHGTDDSAKPEVTGKVQFGTIAHKYNPDASPLRKDVGLGISGGNATAGYTVDGSWEGEGDFEKYRHGEQRNLHGGMRFDQGILSGNLSLRDSRMAYHQGLSILDPVAVAQHRPISMGDPGNRYEYQISTLAGTITAEPIAGWRNTLTMGSDDNTFATFTRSATAGDPEAVDQSNSAARSVHFSSSYDAAMNDALQYSVVAGGDRVDYTQSQLSSASRNTSHINGIFGQAQIGWLKTLYLTGGMHGDQSPGEDGTYWAPRVGLSFVHNINSMTVKARAGFGSTVVLADPRNRLGFITPTEIRVPNLGLLPTLQRGLDMGGELYFGNKGSVGVTYYNQAAINQVGGITLPDTGSAGQAMTQSVNLGRIRNTGWEFTGTLTAIQSLSLRGQFGSARSVAEDISPQYVGIVKTGDVLPGIPRWTAGLVGTYTPFSGTVINFAATHMATWRDLDMYQFMDAIFSGKFRGDQRPYYVNYPAWTKFNIGLTKTITSSVSGFVQVENAANNYAYERLNVIQQAGRTTSVGLRYRTP
jgi:outer membrane receptor protein involved in Fe transport